MGNSGDVTGGGEIDASGRSTTCIFGAWHRLAFFVFPCVAATSATVGGMAGDAGACDGDTWTRGRLFRAANGERLAAS
jgi:hypothetical protein